MKHIFITPLSLFFCLTAFAQSCDYCGTWVYDRFEYAGRITTDCDANSKWFSDDSTIVLTENSFTKSYYINIPKSTIDNVTIEMRSAEYWDDDEIVIKKAGTEIESFLFAPPDTLYLSRDGCNFYFKRVQ